MSEIKDDLSRFLREAETQEIIITRHGKPAGVLIGFESEDDWFEYRLENDPRFLQRIDQARQSLRAGVASRSRTSISIWINRSGPTCIVAPRKTGDCLGRHVWKARLPRAAQAGRRRHHFRQSRHHRIAADGRARGRERAALRARPAGGGRHRRWRTATRRRPASSRWSISTSRPASATPWACSTTRRRPARRSSSPPASTTRNSAPLSRSCGPTCRRSRGRW